MWKESWLDDDSFLDDGEDAVTVASISKTPTKEEAARIVGESNVKRYWDDRIPEYAAYVLEKVESNWTVIYQELEERGWKGRSVSLLQDIVEYYRRNPPLNEVVDEVATVPPPLEKSALERDGTLDGKITVISDSQGEPCALALTFPYSDHFVALARKMPGRKWNGAKKRWEVPIEYAETVFRNFKFERSPKAREIEASL